MTSGVCIGGVNRFDTQDRVSHADSLGCTPETRAAIPCVEGRPEYLSSPTERAALIWGAILPASLSFMPAARSRGLGSVLTSIHLDYEQKAAAVLGIPYDRIMQAGLIPVAYTLGTTFKPAARKPLDSVLPWDRW